MVLVIFLSSPSIRRTCHLSRSCYAQRCLGKPPGHLEPQKPAPSEASGSWLCSPWSHQSDDHHPRKLGWDTHTSVTWGPHLCREMPEQLLLIHLGKLIWGSVSSEHLENKGKGWTRQPWCCILGTRGGFSKAALENITIITELHLPLNTLLGKPRPQHKNTWLLLVLSQPWGWRSV